MGTYFTDFSLTTGSNDGSSWEDALQTVSAVQALLTSDPGSTFLMKEHTGVDISSAGFVVASTGCTFYGGFDSALTGTNYDIGARTAVTVFDGGESDVKFMYFNQSLQATFVFDRLKIVDCYSTSDGSGFYMYSHGYAATVTLQNVEIDNCDAVGTDPDGGGGYFYVPTFYALECHIHNCGGKYGAAIYLNQSDGSFRNCTITDNTAVEGVIRLNGSTGYFVECTVAGNNGSLIIRGNAPSYLADCIFDNTSGTLNVDGADLLNNCITDTRSGTPNSESGTTTDSPVYLGSGDHPYQLAATCPTSITDGASTSATGYADYDILGVDRDDSTPSIGSYEYLAGNTDTLLGGSYSHSGLTLPAFVGLANILLGGSYLYSGSTLSVSHAQSDTLLSGAYSYSGLTLVVSQGHTDVPLAGSYSYSGLTLSVSHAQSDTLLGGTYSHSGLTLTVSQGHVGTLLGGMYSHSGLTLSAYHARSDTLLSGTYSYTGATLTVSQGYSDVLLGGIYSHSGLTLSVSEGTSDTLLGGSYTYSGVTLNVEHAHSDTLLGGTYSYSGLILSATTGRTDNLLGGAYVYSGATIQAYHARSDTLLGGTYSYSGLTLSASAGREDQLLGGNYSHSGTTLSVSYAPSSTLLGGTYSYSGMTLSAFTSYSDVLLPGAYSYSGMTLNVLHERSDVLLVGSYSYDGATIDFYAGDSSQLSRFRTKFPLLDVVADAYVLAALLEATYEVNEDDWGPWYELGLFYFAAYLVSAQFGAEYQLGGMVVKSRKVGRSSVSFDVPESSWFAGSRSTNWYGYRFDEIVEMHIGQEFIVAPGNPARSAVGTDEDTPITPAAVRAKFPVFASYDTDVIQAAIDEAALELWEDSWGDRYELGLLYFTAYLLNECAGPGAESFVGAVTSRTEGNVSVSFATPSTGVTSLHAFNWYGDRYDQMIADHVGQGAFVV